MVIGQTADQNKKHMVALPAGGADHLIPCSPPITTTVITWPVSSTWWYDSGRITSYLDNSTQFQLELMATLRSLLDAS
jgi:hypothetical protein